MNLPFFTTLRQKMMFLFGLLMLVVFFVLAFVLLSSKEKELRTDLYLDTENFIYFAQPYLVEAYEKYFLKGQFLAFQKETQKIMKIQESIRSWSLYSYSGVLLYDSIQDSEQMWQGNVRQELREPVLARLQSPYFSLENQETGDYYFRRSNEEDRLEWVNQNEMPVETVSYRDKISSMLLPVSPDYSLEFKIVDDSIRQAMVFSSLQILVVAFFALVLSLWLSSQFARYLSVPLERLTAGVKKVGAGNFKVRFGTNFSDELGILGKTMNQMVKELKKAIDNLRFKERVAHELDLATKIQKNLLPSKAYDSETLCADGGLIPASEIGGDAFDYVTLDNQKTLFYLGDVTGHGVSAGIMSSVANAVLYAYKDEETLLGMAQAINQVLKAKSSPNVFMTMALCLWDPEKSTLEYANCGHPPIFWYHAQTQSIELLKSQGMALAMIPDIRPLLHPMTLELESGDCVFIYSDGAGEAHNPKGDMMGVERLEKIFKKALQKNSVQAMKQSILEDVLKFIAGPEREDDITVLLLQKK